MAKITKEKSSFDFGVAYAELQEIIGWFEREEVDLDEGLKKFERGLVLAKQCKERLKDVENKVSKIKEKFDDEGTGEPFPDEEEKEEGGPAKLL